MTKNNILLHSYLQFDEYWDSSHLTILQAISWNFKSIWNVSMEKYQVTKNLNYMLWQ
jgi:hypothetical protein